MTISVSDTGNSQTILGEISRSIASAVSQVVQRAVDHFDFNFSRVMLMCSLVTRSCCISLETGLVLNSEYVGPFYIFFCVTFVLADVSCRLIDVQAAT